MDFHFIYGTIKKVNRPEDKPHTANVKLLNGDLIKNIPFMLALGTNENRFGSVMLDCGVEVVLVKSYGSNWLIIGEISLKRNASATSQKEETQSHITDAVEIIKHAFEDALEISDDIAKNQGNVAKALYSAAAGFKQTGSSVAGSPSTPLSNASSIISSGVAVGGYAVQVQLSSIKTRAKIKTFLQKYPSDMDDSNDSQKEQFTTIDECGG